jgi:nucleotide-binding universal stress UspA family protein
MSGPVVVGTDGTIHSDEALGALVRALDLPRSALPPHRIVCDDLEASALLIHAAIGTGAELIVIGQHHRHLLDRLVHAPSRASKLAWRSHAPVVVVPEPDPANDALDAGHAAAAGQ